MPSRLLTLFGEELIPEEIGSVPRPAAHNGDAAAAPEGGEAQEPGAQPEAAVILAGWTPDKQYYTIGEVAKLFNVRTSPLRYWTTEFGLKVRTTRKGDRLYTPASIGELRSIYHLVKERGYTIPGAKAKLKEGQRSSAATLDLKQALLQLRNQLVTIRNELL